MTSARDHASEIAIYILDGDENNYPSVTLTRSTTDIETDIGTHTQCVFCCVFLFGIGCVCTQAPIHTDSEADRQTGRHTRT